VWKNPGDGTIWYSTHDLSSGNYQAETWNWYYQGYRPVFVSAFVRNSAARLNSIWYYNGGITPANMQAIDNAVSSYMSTSGVPGVSLAISRQGRLVYAKGFGYGDVAAGELVHPHNRFRIASVSKTITAAAVLKLRDHCGLDLDQAVFGPGAILDEVYGTPPYSARERAITVRHLLNHTTGWTDDGIWNVASSDPNEVVSWQLDNTEPASPTGTSYQYMNADFCTAGRVVEMRSGRTYEQFVKDEILAPSCITDMEIGGSTLAERKPGEVVYYGGNPYGLNLSRMDANGGWIARPIDLLLFLRRIDSNTNQAEILQSGSLTQMRTPSGTPGQGMGYGFGLVVNPSGGPFGNNEWGHNGAMDGTTAFLVYRTDGMAFAFACNNWPADWAGNLRQIIDNLITTLSAANAWPNYDLFPCDVPPGDPPVQMEVAKNVYVDGSSSCIFQNGHKDCIFGGPFSMVTQGFNGAPCSGDHLFIRAGSYNETIVLNRRMTLQSYDGVAVIGK